MEARYWAALDRFVELCGREWEREERRQRRREREWAKVVATSTGLQPKDVKSAVEGIFTLAAKQMKKCGKFNLAGMLTLKLKVRPATKAHQGVNPFTKEPCVFNRKPASKTVKATPRKKFKTMVNWSWVDLAGESVPNHASLNFLRQ